MKYQIAEKFKSLQGEGVYSGTPMAFIRFVGCSVGKKICQHCDTVFERTLPWQGGGEFIASDLLDWAFPYEHICYTGGEPFDTLDEDFFLEEVMHPDLASWIKPMYHVETSGTVDFRPFLEKIGLDRSRVWICVSPKPGFLETAIDAADEVKVIVPGLGTEESLRLLERPAKDRPVEIGKPLPLQHDLASRVSFRWPTISDAIRWAERGKTVFLQPRNGITEIDKHNLMIVMDLLRDYPMLRLSTQLHKILKVQ